MKQGWSRCTHSPIPSLPNSSPQTHTQPAPDGSWSSPLTPTSQALVEEDLTSLEPVLTTLFFCQSPEETTTSPLLPWARLRSWGTSAAPRGCFPTDGPRAGKGLGKVENLPSSQQRLLNHWLVAPQETPCCAHLERHVPSEVRLSAGREWTGGCRRSTPWHMQPPLGHSW